LNHRWLLWRHLLLRSDCFLRNRNCWLRRSFLSHKHRLNHSIRNAFVVKLHDFIRAQIETRARVLDECHDHIVIDLRMHQFQNIACFMGNPNGLWRWFWCGNAQSSVRADPCWLLL